MKRTLKIKLLTSLLLIISFTGSVFSQPPPPPPAPIDDCLLPTLGLMIISVLFYFIIKSNKKIDNNINQ